MWSHGQLPHSNHQRAAGRIPVPVGRSFNSPVGGANRVVVAPDGTRLFVRETTAASHEQQEPIAVPTLHDHSSTITSAASGGATGASADTAITDVDSIDLRQREQQLFYQEQVERQRRNAVIGHQLRRQKVAALLRAEQQAQLLRHSHSTPTDNASATSTIGDQFLQSRRRGIPAASIDQILPCIHSGRRPYYLNSSSAATSFAVASKQREQQLLASNQLDQRLWEQQQQLQMTHTNHYHPSAMHAASAASRMSQQQYPYQVYDDSDGKEDDRPKSSTTEKQSKRKKESKTTKKPPKKQPRTSFKVQESFALRATAGMVEDPQLASASGSPALPTTSLLALNEDSTMDQIVQAEAELRELAALRQDKSGLTSSSPTELSATSNLHKTTTTATVKSTSKASQKETMDWPLVLSPAISPVLKEDDQEEGITNELLPGFDDHHHHSELKLPPLEEKSLENATTKKNNEITIQKRNGKSTPSSSTSMAVVSEEIRGGETTTIPDDKKKKKKKKILDKKTRKGKGFSGNSSGDNTKSGRGESWSRKKIIQAPTQTQTANAVAQPSLNTNSDTHKNGDLHVEKTSKKTLDSNSSSKRRRVPTTKAVLGSLETLDAELSKPMKTTPKPANTVKAPKTTNFMTRKRQRKEETSEVFEVKGLEKARAKASSDKGKSGSNVELKTTAAASSKISNGRTPTAKSTDGGQQPALSKRESSALTYHSSSKRRKTKSNITSSKSSSQRRRNSKSHDPIKEIASNNEGNGDDEPMADLSLPTTKEEPSPPRNKEVVSSIHDKERIRTCIPILKSGPVSSEVEHVDKCSKCKRIKAKRGCSQSACLTCCTDTKCEGHREIREKAKLEEAILNGTTDIQIKAATKRASAILPGTFREKSFQYHSETSVLWSFHDYMAVPKWREDTIRKSLKRSRRRESAKASPGDINSDAPRKVNRKQRFKRVMDDLYKTSQAERKNDCNNAK